ncbi:MAG TPA: mitofilin family membrane protein [Acidocella sp.]|nr:mitofilin family membrane protein [Acidocella sp.]
MSDSETTTSSEPVPGATPMPVPTPTPEPTAEPAPEPAPRPTRRPRWPYALLALILLLIAAGEAYLWVRLKAEAANATQLAVLQAQVADLRALAIRTQPASGSIATQADLSVKLATVAAQLNAVQSQMAADHGALTTLQSNTVDLAKLTRRITLLNQLAAARMALDAGQPLGIIANAPPALSIFASEPPPTEASLRLGFPAAARAAEAASVAGDTKGGVWAHAVARLENFVTISAGSHVLIGAPAAAVIAQARTLLDAGDLAGAVAELGKLSATTQAAMGGWLTQARALVAARAALAEMARQA